MTNTTYIHPVACSPGHDYPDNVYSYLLFRCLFGYFIG